MEAPTPMHMLSIGSSQVSPELEERGGFAQENRGCWMLKAMERDRGRFWRLSVSRWILAAFWFQAFYCNISCSCMVPASILNVSIYLCGLAPREVCHCPHVTWRDVRREAISRLHGHCMGTVVLCPATAQLWHDRTWLLPGVTNVYFLTLHILWAGIRIMHHIPYWYRDRTWPLSAQSLAVWLWTQRCTSLG